MKKNLSVFLLVLLLSFQNSLRAQEISMATRALFVSVIQDPPVLASKESIRALIEYSKQARIQILFVQLYRSGKAYFPSAIVDSAEYDSERNGLGEDPIQFLLKEAHAAGIEVHAWLNMLSLGANENASFLKKYGPEILTRNTNMKEKLADYRIDNQYFLEPGDLRVRQESVNLVEELLRHYPGLDGIQFDYIRYPDEHPAYGHTKMNRERFSKTTGIQIIEDDSKIWKDWKRAQVTEFLELLIAKTKAIRPKIKISTTGCMSYIRAYHEAFQDWPSWVNRGIIDFVTIMSYAPEPVEFQKNILDAKNRVDDFRKVNIAIPAYKLAESPEAFREEWELCRESGSGACVVFHYGSLLESEALRNYLTEPKSNT